MNACPPLVDALLPPARRALAVQFLRFGVVGTAGFVVDTAVLYGLLAIGGGLYSGRILSYVAAATATWALNRIWTFRTAQGPDGRAGLGRQWLIFLAVNLVGFALNYSTYVLMVANLPLAAADPILGVAAGALVGMTGNFLLSRRYVFGAQ
ncbi:GtrA family protein [Roseomonas chloroacetimidivorans]|jgi:putative flippase GtrA|uniref:GtrA family protein n=1 Tax=Roseomonas chloroacetimidivorans TaxID=1766656 RepID=UPI003C768E55